MNQCSGGCCIGNIVNSPILYNGRTLTVNGNIDVPNLSTIPSNMEGGNILLYQDLEVETNTEYTDNYITLNGIELPLRDIKIQYHINIISFYFSIDRMKPRKGIIKLP